MSEEIQAEYIAALVDLHRGLPRQGPGDPKFTLELLSKLPPLPENPKIADLGCGSGAGALLLAKHYQNRVKAVDASSLFIEELKVNAVQAKLDHLVEPICADMANLGWPHASVDLLWSEGAAYNLGFEHALKTWKPLMAMGGLAVISEMSWFTDTPPKPAWDFWSSAYPAMSTEKQNAARAKGAGFSVEFTVRLPSSAWWDNYYGPLSERIRQTDKTPANQTVIQETEQEMSLFEKYSDHYGYTFYVLKVTDPDST